MNQKRLRLGEILVDAGVLGPEQLERALALQKKRGIRLGQVLLQEGFISEAQLVQALSRRLSIPWVSLGYVDIADELLDLVPARVAEEYFLVPVYIQSLDPKNRTLFVAMNDPTDETALRFVAASAGMPVKPMVAGPSEISAAIQSHYYGEEEPEHEPPMIHNVSAPPPPPPSRPKPEATASKNPVSPTVDVERTEDSPSETDLTESDLILADESELAEKAAQSIEEMVENRNEQKAKKQRMHREVEKHMFGVGTKRKGMSLTLLDGTKIDFGGANRSSAQTQNGFSKDDLIEGLLAAANGTPMEDFLPADKWEEYMAALLNLLFKKNLIFFKEFIQELKKQD